MGGPEANFDNFLYGIAFSVLLITGFNQVEKKLDSKPYLEKNLLISNPKIFELFKLEIY